MKRLYIEGLELRVRLLSAVLDPMTAARFPWSAHRVRM